jgi:DNA primase catalytic core
MGPEAVKEEVRERIDLVDLVSQYVELKQSGRNWKGLCPFHPEKTPSFNVNRESRFWKCFGCGAGGDVFSFVMRIENVTFVEAGRMLAERVGLRWEPAHARPEERDERDEILRANAMAADWYAGQLAAPGGRAARAYLERRGLDEATIARFRLGCAPPGWDGLVSHLARSGVGSEAAIRAGLARRSEQGTVYDYFRNRIIFPITDVVGKVIAFGGRALDPDEPAKYLNSPDTPLFRKGRTFYALDLARRAISDEGHAVVVEGYMDVVALVQHGIENCIATLGTALTDQHARVLARYTQEIVLLYDADAAGIEAALRSVRAFEECPAAVKVAVLPEGKDPDDTVREFGAAGLRELLEQRIGLVEYRLRTIFARTRGQGSEGRTRAAREAVDVLSDVPAVRRAELLRWAAHEWAQGDVRNAPALERLLLQEVERSGQEKTGAGPDGWPAVLAEKGLRRPSTGGGGRWLTGREWAAQRAERERRLAPLAQDAALAQGAGLPPDSPHSTVSSEFIGDALSRSASPFVQSALKLERRILTAMIRRPGLAPTILAQLRPEELLLPIHQEIATAVARSERGPDEASAGGLADRLAEDEAVFAAAVEIAVDEEDYDLTDLPRDIAHLREARFLGGEARRLCETSEQSLCPPEDAECLATLEREVQARLAEGTLTTDDPLYERYMSVKRHLHGSGDLPCWDVD